MWLLNCETHQLESFEGENCPPYAILSHRWERKEVSFQDVVAGRHTEMESWQKIKSCCEQAKRDKLEYAWADTCCIDKSSSAELSEAINSMYKWYKQAAVCYAYLVDKVSPAEVLTQRSTSKQKHPPYQQALTRQKILLKGSELTESVWFTRGWTLQELLAPRHLVFYDAHWTRLGTKSDFGPAIEKKSNIPIAALKAFHPKDWCIAQKMSWAAGRRTSRVEDRTYSLLGLFDINMPLLYGEGSKAYERLQYELIRTSTDPSIYGWSVITDVPLSDRQTGPLAISPDSYHWDNSYTWAMSPVFKSIRASETSVSKEGISGRFNLVLLNFDVFAASLGRLRQINGRDCQLVIYLKKTGHNLYERVILDSRGCEITSLDSNTYVSTYEPAPFITIQLGRLHFRSSESIPGDVGEETHGDLTSMALYLLCSTKFSKMVDQSSCVSKRLGELCARWLGAGLEDKPLLITSGYYGEEDVGVCLLLRLVTRSLIVRFSVNIENAPTALTYFTDRHTSFPLKMRMPEELYNKTLLGSFRNRQLTLSKCSSWKSRAVEYTPRDHEVLRSAFREIDQEKANGVPVQSIGPDIKIAFVRTEFTRPWTRTYRVTLMLCVRQLISTKKASTEKHPTNTTTNTNFYSHAIKLTPQNSKQHLSAKNSKPAGIAVGMSDERFTPDIKRSSVRISRSSG